MVAEAMAGIVVEEILVREIVTMEEGRREDRAPMTPCDLVPPVFPVGPVFVYGNTYAWWGFGERALERTVVELWHLRERYSSRVQREKTKHTIVEI